MLRRREISSNDLDAIVDLLARGFQDDRRFRDHASRMAFWRSAIQWLASLPTPPGRPKYGYCLDTGTCLVGVVLLSFIAIDGDIRCNVSSWYVEPAFRAYASILASYAARHTDVTFFNLTPAPHTWKILEAQGYVKYVSGRFVAVPALSRSLQGTHARSFTETMRPGPDLSPSEVDVLRDHAQWGCLSFVCEYEGRRYPFVFKIRRARSFLPAARLIYCRSFESFVRFSGTIGRYLSRHGCHLIITDANGPIPGLPGFYLNGARRYCRGGKAMRLGDMAYSEILLLD